MAIPERVGPVVAVAILELFLHRQWEITEDEADQLFDAVIGLLEKARDEKWRYRTSPGTEG